jgi:hypothetical protein
MALPLFSGGASRLQRYARHEMGGMRDGIITCDTFDRADGTDLGSTNNLPYLAGRPGIAWMEVAGNWEINGRRLGSQGSSPGGQGWLVTLDIGESDYVLEWTLAYAPDANSNGIIVAYVDGTNFIRLNHSNAACAFIRFTAGVGTSIGVSAGVGTLPGDILQLTKSGSSYSGRILRAGVQVGNTATATDAQGAASTVIGLRAATAAVRWTNLVARRAA